MKHMHHKAHPRRLDQIKCRHVDVVRDLHRGRYLNKWMMELAVDELSGQRLMLRYLDLKTKKRVQKSDATDVLPLTKSN